MGREVTVEPRPDGAFAVEVHQGSAVTRHVVTVPDGLAAALGHPELQDADLVRRSFEFLLEREPATSILGRFDLGVIEGYFPGYRSEMAARIDRQSS